MHWRSHLLTLFLKIFVFWILTVGMLFAEEFSFKLSTKGVTFGSFEMMAKEANGHYQISSTFKSTGILGVFTRIKIISGAYGKIHLNESHIKLKPAEVLSKWQSLIDSKQSKIKYKGSKIVQYEVLPNPRENPYAIDPFKESNTIDPLSVTYWMLRKRKYSQLCLGREVVSEGQSLILVKFIQKKKIDKFVHCEGQFTFLKGFDPKKYRDTKFPFKLIYANLERAPQFWKVNSILFNTRLGLVHAVRER